MIDPVLIGDATLYRGGIVTRVHLSIADEKARGPDPLLVQAREETNRWAGAAKTLFAMIIHKPYGTWNECRSCGRTWWDDEQPRHHMDCAALAALAALDAKLGTRP